jgi:alkylation response protein AidB-like acyl-CoA dehydrogenase
MPIVQAVRDEGLFRCELPATLGGGEMDPRWFYEMVEELARLDSSTGWCTFIAAGGSTLGRFFSADTAEEAFGEPDSIMAGSVYPPGRAVATEGGYSVSGHWAFASGCQHSNWLAALCSAWDGDERRIGPSGIPETRAILFPTRDAEIVETWDVSGLVATGSHDFRLDRYFVPDRRSAVLRPQVANEHFRRPLYGLPFLAIFGWSIGAVALGIARAAIEDCRELAISKVPRGSETTLAKKPLFQYQLADAFMMASAGRAWLHAELDSMWQTAQRGEPVEMDARARASLSAAHAVRSCAAAVDLLYTAGGGTSNYRTSPLQKHLRDIHAVTQHAVTSPQTIEAGGKLLAGEGTTNPLMFL